MQAPSSDSKGPVSSVTGGWCSGQDTGVFLWSQKCCWALGLKGFGVRLWW